MDVLIVDDSKFQRSQIQSMIEEKGNNCLLASDGLEALEVIENNKGKIDIIFTDLLMPVMDGVEFLKTLKENNNEIKVVVISANIQKPVKEECLNLGAAGFINKPVEPDLLDKYLLT
jgi:CheY-like chemotaxis protein